MRVVKVVQYYNKKTKIRDTNPDVTDPEWWKEQAALDLAPLLLEFKNCALLVGSLSKLILYSFKLAFYWYKNL